MLPKYPALLLSGSFLSSATTSPAAPLAETNRQSAACESTHIFIARALGEPYPGRQGDLANAICQGNSSCSYQSIEYTGTRANYCSAVGTGVANGAEAISAYAAECPGAKLVLTGYSMGAHVVGDILGGGGGDCPMGGSQPANDGLDPDEAPGNQIVAATLFGDVRHAPGQSYNQGTGADGSGAWPRQGNQLNSLNKWTSKLRSWCVSGDPVCARGDDGSAHGSYFEAGGIMDEAAQWVRERL
ncbi:hypothetical protein FQN53_003912 [Emmonsiellopsis sp. PD_33]|nr:hypothetical protein FQN53_003912 [Emmonsiellopsis sp. PD_33]